MDRSSISSKQNWEPVDQVFDPAAGAGGETGSEREPVEGVVHGVSDPAKFRGEQGVCGGAAAVDQRLCLQYLGVDFLQDGVEHVKLEPGDQRPVAGSFPQCRHLPQQALNLQRRHPARATREFPPLRL